MSTKVDGYIQHVLPSLIDDFAEATLTHLTKLQRIAREEKKPPVYMPSIDEIKLTLNTCLSNYIAGEFARVSRIYTILYKVDPEPIEEIFVDPTFTALNSGASISTNEIKAQILKGEKFLITASAGMGKTIFIRSVYVDAVVNQLSFFPIFVEFRLINLMRKGSGIIDLIYASIERYGFPLPYTYIEGLLTSGRVVLLLDAFDEIGDNFLLKIEGEFSTFLWNYQKCGAIVTSRPMTNVSRLHSISKLDLNPLKLEQAIDLIGKLKFDPVKKTVFSDRLRTEYYATHKVFCSNPLLLTLMFLTFDQTGGVPNRMPMFYEQAFDTLFNKHDATKEAYVRDIRSGLDLHDFKQIFSAFSFSTYLKRLLIFSEEGILREVKSAARLARVQVAASDYFSDIRKRVCLIVEEGSKYEFAHRSFQEYFCALYLCRTESLPRIKIIDAFAKSRRGDQVLDLARFINRPLVDYDWLMMNLRAQKENAGGRPLFDNIKTKQGRIPKPRNPSQEFALDRYIAPSAIVGSSNMYVIARVSDEQDAWSCAYSTGPKTIHLLLYWTMRFFPNLVNEKINVYFKKPEVVDLVSKLLVSDLKLIYRADHPIMSSKDLYHVAVSVGDFLSSVFDELLETLSQEHREVEEDMEFIERIVDPET